MRYLWPIGLLLFSLANQAADLATYAGNYSANGRTLAIAEWETDPTAPHVLAFTDFTSGRFGMLSEIAPDSYTLQEHALAGAEVARIRFIRRGDAVTGLVFAEKGKRSLTAKRIPHRTIEMVVGSGGQPLAATLRLPAGKGPFAAVAIVPAGRVGQTAAATFPYFFLSQGMAVLTYDGRKGPRPFEARARDAISAVDATRRRREIDGRKVGLWGHSQGGWLSVIAASESPDIAFVIDHSGMFVAAWQQELYRLSAEGMADGISAVDVAAAVSFEARLMDVARTGSGWEEVTSTLRNDKGEWQDLVYKPASLSELQEVWRDDFSFDPRPFAKRVKQPLLALFGGLDRSTPIESAANLKRSLPPNANLKEVFFPTANHAFLEAATGGNREIPNLTRFAPGMFGAMRRWLRSEVLTRH